jgi:hypothetical protein
MEYFGFLLIHKVERAEKLLMMSASQGPTSESSLKDWQRGLNER